MARKNKDPLITYIAFERLIVAQIKAILLKSSKKIEEEIKNIPSGAHPLTKAEAEASRIAVNKILDGDWKSVQDLIERGRIEASNALLKLYQEQERDYLRTMFTDEEIDIIFDSERYRASGSIERLTGRLSSSKKTLSSRVYNSKSLAEGWVEDAINHALIRGKSAADLAKEIRKMISPNTPGGVSYAAMRLARTEINNSAHAATVAHYQDNSDIVEYVEWNLSSSHPEGDECDSYAENTVPGKAERGLWPVDAVPEKPHPQCLCYITPHLPSPEEFMKDLREGKYDDTRKKHVEEDLTKIESVPTPPSQSRLIDSGESDQLEHMRRVVADPRVIRAYNGKPSAEAWEDLATGTPYRQAIPRRISQKTIDEDPSRFQQLYRGMAENPSASNAEMLSQLQYGLHRAGSGVYGSGSYFTDSLEKAQQYSGKSGILVSGMLDKKGSVVVSSQDLLYRQTVVYNKLSKEFSGNPEVLATIENARLDPSLFAMQMGVDVIHVPTTGVLKKPAEYFVVLNRSALVNVEEK